MQDVGYIREVKAKEQPERLPEPKGAQPMVLRQASLEFACWTEWNAPHTALCTCMQSPVECTCLLPSPRVAGQRRRKGG